MRRSILASVVLLAGCALDRSVEALEDRSPPPGLGRPAWVSAPATGGAWVLGAGGWAASIVTLPLTFPIARLADEPLGYAREEFLFWGAPVGASTGYVGVGAPLDSLDYLFRRAWVVGPEVTIDNERTPIEPRPASTY